MSYQPLIGCVLSLLPAPPLWMPISLRELHTALQKSDLAQVTGRYGDYRLDFASSSPSGKKTILTFAPLMSPGGPTESRRALVDLSREKPCVLLSSDPVEWADDTWIFVRAESSRYLVHSEHAAQYIVLPPEIYSVRTSPSSSIAFGAQHVWVAEGAAAGNPAWYCIQLPQEFGTFEYGPPVIERCDALDGWLISARGHHKAWITSSIGPSGEVRSTRPGRLLPSGAVRGDLVLLSDHEGIAYTVYRVSDSSSQWTALASLPKSASPIASSPDGRMLAAYPVRGSKLSRWDTPSILISLDNGDNGVEMRPIEPFCVWLPAHNRFGIQPQ